MATATDRQAIPITSLAIGAHVQALLNAAVALAPTSTGTHLALLPDEEHYPVIEATILAWARTKGFTVEEWGHWSRPPSENDAGWWIEGFKVSHDHHELCTLHTPHRLRRRQPGMNETVAAKAESESDQLWSPAHPHAEVTP